MHFPGSRALAFRRDLWFDPGMMRHALFHAVLAVLVLGGCQTGKSKFTLSVHSQGDEMESPRSIMPDLVGNPPRKVILKRSPEFTHNNIAAFHAFPADTGNGNGVALKLDFKGKQALELVTRMRAGEILRTLVNGKGADYVVIDRPIADGIFIVWEGVPDEVVAEMTKKYPSIKGLSSACSKMEMTPTTKTEKKKAFGLFKKTEREEEKKAKAEDAVQAEDPAAIQTPAEGFEPALPEGAMQ